MNFTIYDIILAYTSNRYRLIDNGKPNIFGIRSKEEDINKFNDIIGFIRRVGKKWEWRHYEATTKSGLYYMHKPINPNGTAIIAKGQYKNVYRVGFHKNRYKALLQDGVFKVYRDNNKDSIIDYKNLQAAMKTGLNLHRANKTSIASEVNKYSAGCQVIRRIDDFREMMRIVEDYATNSSQRFDYTLFNEEDIIKARELDIRPKSLLSDF